MGGSIAQGEAGEQREAMGAAEGGTGNVSRQIVKVTDVGRGSAKVVVSARVPAS
jgi:hypothetical protein